MSSKQWEDFRVARFEYRRQVSVSVFALLLLLGIAVWALIGAGLAATGFVVLGWFASIVAFELTRLTRGKTENGLGIALAVCVFLGVFFWGWYNGQPEGLSFFGLATGFFLIHAERIRRDKRRVYQKLSAWNRQ